MTFKLNTLQKELAALVDRHTNREGTLYTEISCSVEISLHAVDVNVRTYV